MYMVNMFVAGACAASVVYHVSKGNAGWAVLTTMLAIFNVTIALLLTV